MNDNELFELSKSVYEATGWNKTEFMWVAPPFNDTDYKIMHKSELHELNDYIKHPEMIDKMYNSTFAYDTDYLLEKLHHHIEHLIPQAQGWAVQGDFDYLGVDKKYFYADTPVKCLLKLTLELSKKGLLDAKDN